VSKSKHFFATRKDLELGILRIEDKMDLQYVECLSCESSSFVRYASILEVSTLGVNLSGDHLKPSFLVMARSATVAIERISLRKGGIRYSVTQQGNEGSIVFQPGGLYSGLALVAGHLSTIHHDPFSLELLKGYSGSVFRGFKQVRSFWVGPEALGILDSGGRLVTMGIDEPIEYDLKR